MPRAPAKPGPGIHGLRQGPRQCKRGWMVRHGAVGSRLPGCLPAGRASGATAPDTKPSAAPPPPSMGTTSPHLPRRPAAPQDPLCARRALPGYAAGATVRVCVRVCVCTCARVLCERRALPGHAAVAPVHRVQVAPLQRIPHTCLPNCAYACARLAEAASARRPKLARPHAAAACRCPPPTLPPPSECLPLLPVPALIILDALAPMPASPPPCLPWPSPPSRAPQEVVESLKPTVLVGVAASPGAFDEKVLKVGLPPPAASFMLEHGAHHFALGVHAARVRVYTCLRAARAARWRWVCVPRVP